MNLLATRIVQQRMFFTFSLVKMPWTSLLISSSGHSITMLNDMNFFCERLTTSKKIMMMVMMMVMNCFLVWLTDERHLALFPARIIVRDFPITNFGHAISRIWTCAEPEFRLWWIKLCSSDNRYTMVPPITLEITASNPHLYHQFLIFG